MSLLLLSISLYLHISPLHYPYYLVLSPLLSPYIRPEPINVMADFIPGEVEEPIDTGDKEVDLKAAVLVREHKQLHL